MTLSLTRRTPATVRGNRCRRPEAGLGLLAVFLAVLVAMAVPVPWLPASVGTATAGVPGSGNAGALNACCGADGPGLPSISGASRNAALAAESEPPETDPLTVRSCKPTFFTPSPTARKPGPATPPERRCTPIYLRHQSLLC